MCAVFHFKMKLFIHAKNSFTVRTAFMKINSLIDIYCRLSGEDLCVHGRTWDRIWCTCATFIVKIVHYKCHVWSFSNGFRDLTCSGELFRIMHRFWRGFCSIKTRNKRIVSILYEYYYFSRLSGSYINLSSFGYQ